MPNLAARNPIAVATGNLETLLQQSPGNKRCFITYSAVADNQALLPFLTILGKSSVSTVLSVSKVIIPLLQCFKAAADIAQTQLVLTDLTTLTNMALVLLNKQKKVPVDFTKTLKMILQTLGSVTLPRIYGSRLPKLLQDFQTQVTSFLQNNLQINSILQAKQKMQPAYG
jgi:hypothetical protein